MRGPAALYQLDVGALAQAMVLQRSVSAKGRHSRGERARACARVHGQQRSSHCCRCLLVPVFSLLVVTAAAHCHCETKPCRLAATGLP